MIFEIKGSLHKNNAQWIFSILIIILIKAIRTTFLYLNFFLSHLVFEKKIKYKLLHVFEGTKNTNLNEKGKFFLGFHQKKNIFISTGFYCFSVFENFVYILIGPKCIKKVKISLKTFLLQKYVFFKNFNTISQKMFILMTSTTPKILAIMESIL